MPGTLVVRRPRGGWRDVARSYRIQVDGRTRGRVRRGGTLTVPLDSGHYVVRARIDWTGSPPVDVNVLDGVVVECVVEPAGSAGSALFQLGRGQYLRLSVVAEEEQPRWE
ncbi:hypothetical protein K8W59_12840 [Nocardioides rotundus]|uniref:hypothetical protein n=1 Tax=Nocardioides rotundus TaxID=1774216 RepID=UPI001CBCD551|nr:hypothetical protein [Nocardioides rotundus]UAL28741.1 hypothetical protein K8W59_12840 [Nocardioides rotundus]